MHTSWVALLALLLCWHVAAADALAGTTCTTAFDCSLNGACGANGTCECLPGWRNPACAILDIAPSPYAAGYHNASYASWGGNALFDPKDGLWHMFVAEMVNHCPLNDWGQNSQIIRASSQTVDGPFKFAAVVVSPFAHNPTVRQLPDGSGFVLFMIGGVPTTPANCSTDGPQPSERRGAAAVRGASGSIRVSYAKHLAGPWSQPQVVEFDHVNSTSWIGCGYTNPSPFVFDNGSVLLAFQGGPCKDPSPFDVEMIGVALAPSWNATYSVLNHGQPIVLPEWICVAGFGEDPFVWYSAASSSYHMLVHGMCFAPFDSRHLFSSDGANWTLSPFMPYSYEVNYTDHAPEVYWRVERPQLIFDKSLPYGARPIALVNGVCGDGLECLNDPQMTWSLLRSIR